MKIQWLITTDGVTRPVELGEKLSPDVELTAVIEQETAVARFWCWKYCKPCNRVMKHDLKITQTGAHLTFRAKCTQCKTESPHDYEPPG